MSTAAGKHSSAHGECRRAESAMMTRKTAAEMPSRSVTTDDVAGQHVADAQRRGELRVVLLLPT